MRPARALRRPLSAVEDRAAQADLAHNFETHETRLEEMDAKVTAVDEDVDTFKDAVEEQIVRIDATLLKKLDLAAHELHVAGHEQFSLAVREKLGSVDLKLKEFHEYLYGDNQRRVTNVLNSLGQVHRPAPVYRSQLRACDCDAAGRSGGSVNGKPRKAGRPARDPPRAEARWVLEYCECANPIDGYDTLLDRQMVGR